MDSPRTMVSYAGVATRLSALFTPSYRFEISAAEIGGLFEIKVHEALIIGPSVS